MKIKKYMMLFAVLMCSSVVQAQAVEAIFMPTICSVATDNVHATLPVMPVINSSDIRTDYFVFNLNETFSTGIEAIESGELKIDNSQSKKGIYSLTGVKVSDDAVNVKTLRHGIYILDGKKMVVK